MNIGDYISSFGVIAMALFLVWKEYRSGSTTLNSQVVANYKALDEQQKEKITERDTLIAQYEKGQSEIKAAMATMKENFAKEIGKLQGELKAKDEQITILQQTVNDKNPEMVKLLKDIRDFMEQINTTNTHQTQILEAGKTRNEKIDAATEAEAGHILRKD